MNITLNDDKTAFVIDNNNRIPSIGVLLEVGLGMCKTLGIGDTNSIYGHYIMEKQKLRMMNMNDEHIAFLNVNASDDGLNFLTNTIRSPFQIFDFYKKTFGL